MNILSFVRDIRILDVLQLSIFIFLALFSLMNGGNIAKLHTCITEIHEKGILLLQHNLHTPKDKDLSLWTTSCLKTSLIRQCALSYVLNLATSHAIVLTFVLEIVRARAD